MQQFSGISFLWATFALAIMGVTYAVAYFLLTYKVLKDAEADYLYKSLNDMIINLLLRLSIYVCLPRSISLESFYI